VIEGRLARADREWRALSAQRPRLWPSRNTLLVIGSVTCPILVAALFVPVGEASLAARLPALWLPVFSLVAGFVVLAYRLRKANAAYEAALTTHETRRKKLVAELSAAC
jgi:hypothetical protein